VKKIMPYPMLPPRGLFVITDVLFCRDLPTPLRETLLQLMALAWYSHSHETPDLSYPQLSRLTGKPIPTLRGHIGRLRNYYGALRMRSSGTGLFILNFPDWLYHQGTGAEEALSGVVDKNLTTDDENPESYDKNQEEIKEEEEDY
jgi:hypothetical protein